MISLKNVSKFYYNKSTISSGFNKINLDLDMGEFVVITGESGSGKSTLLNVISGLDSYEEGEMYINGEETSHYTEVDYENYRRKYIGNIFQHFNLVNSYTVYQNVELVLLLNGYKRSEVASKINSIIETVGLSKYKNTKASKLSGGQKQRVAIARALAKDTPIIVADEPTGNLDVKSAKSIMKLLKDISKEKLVVIVTHNYEQVEDYATRKIAMNDGKIIEDKKLQNYEKCEAELALYEDLTTSNKIRLGVRNAFNIATKFALLFAVYFFLTLLVTGEYSGLRKQDFTNSLVGYNGIFSDTSPNRVILHKKDKSAFTEEDINKLRALDNVLTVEENDGMLDAEGRVYSDTQEIYVPGHFKCAASLSGVNEGRLPSGPNEIVLGISKDSSTWLFYKDELFNKEMILEEYYSGQDTFKVKIVGVVFEEEDDFYGTIYLSESLFDRMSIAINSRYNTDTLSVGGNKMVLREANYSRVKVLSSLFEGETLIPASFICSDYDCSYNNATLTTSNIYFEKQVNLEVKTLLNANNFKSLTGLANYEDYIDNIFISEADYRKLYDNGNYQVSVFLDDMKVDKDTLKAMDAMGHEYYYLKDNLVDEGAMLKGFFKIIRNVMFFGSTVVLFFISYFIIKIILKSRNVYFSTIRILGATKKVARQLLNIELFVDINVAFFAFVELALLSQSGIITWQYITDMVAYFTLKDYVLVYIVLAIMSFLISNRYAHKLFKDSVMSTYREEV